MKILLFAYSTALLVSCSIHGIVQQTPTLAPYIDRQQAIDLKLKIASNPQPELSGSIERPTVLWAELVPLGEVPERFGI